MKKQKPLLVPGDVVRNSSNGFRRLIKSVDYKERSGILKVMYFYCEEELSGSYDATGRFDPYRIGYCSQDHLIRWRQGR